MSHIECKYDTKVIGSHANGQGTCHQQEGEEDVAREGLVSRGIQETVQSLTKRRSLAVTHSTFGQRPTFLIQ